MMRPRTSKLFLAASALLFTACTTAPTGPAAWERFDSYEAAASADLSGYDNVYLAPIAVGEELTSRIGYRQRGISDTKRAIGERDIERKVADLERELRDDIGKVAVLVPEPGDDVLTIAVTLTDLDSNRPTQSEMAAEPGLSFESRYAGGAAVEMVFSENGTVLVTAKDSEQGTLRLRDLPGGTWYEADMFFSRLADKVAALLD